MKASWPVVVLALGIFAGLVFLVHTKDIPGDILVSFVSLLSGGGIYHAGSKFGGGTG